MARRLTIVAALFLWVLAAAGRGRTQQISAAVTPPFVGAEACAACHREVHDTWKRGRHSRMLQPATSASIVGDFSRDALTLRGRRYQVRAANGEYFVTESDLTGRAQEHRVEYTLGSRRIQHYVATIDKGWMIVLPPTWDVQRREWFHNMEIVRADESNPKAIQQWNKDCVGCHVSGEEKNYRPATQEYATRWQDFGTSCERCHGPGGAHVEAFTRSQSTRPAGERLIVRPTRLDPEASSAICAQCHSLRNVISPNYTAGGDYYDFFNPRLEYDPTATREPAYWADGRPRRFSNDAIGLWQSACFLRGGATCTTCHYDPHEPNVDRRPQLAPENNSLCTRCHEVIGQRLTAHTRHAATSAGSSCLECHMPKTVISIKATMRDHTISVPAPENTTAFGIPNACTECHADRKPAWAAGVLDAWWPRGRRVRLLERARTFSAARRKDPAALDALLAIAADASAPPLIRANALGYLRNYRDDRARGALLAAATADHPALRATAVASLGAVGDGRAVEVRSALAAALADRLRSVRIAALASLIAAGGPALEARDAARLQEVGRELGALAPLYSDDAGFNRDVGMVQLLSGQFDRAGDALQICLQLEPAHPAAKFLLALARLGQGRTDAARKLLAEVPPSDPSYEAARRRLALLVNP
jgi:predicted CXXCH cytochrome family protein